MEAEAVLVTGVYGVGKSTVVAQMADLLEARGHPYAALDLIGWPGQMTVPTTVTQTRRCS